MLAILISTVFALAPQQQDPADNMLRLATADQPLVHQAVVDAPVKEVWNAWTTDEGLQAWMAPKVDFTLRVGGKMLASYDPTSNLNDEKTIENTVISFDPERMLSIKCTKVPKGFPFGKAIEDVWTVLYFSPTPEGKTTLLIRMIGYNGSQESMEMKKFFERGNQATLDELVKHYKK
jgi:uncharacterized protein YndB with AHSA1/START domain